MNIFLFLVGCVLLYNLSWVFFGGWGRGTFITEQIACVAILLLYVLYWISLNVDVEGIKDRVRPFIQSLKNQISCSLKSPSRIAIMLAMIFLLSIPVRWLFFYYVPKYSGTELGNISIEEWHELSKIEKFRIAQSFYIEWRGKQNGLYRAEDYVSLIDDYIKRVSTYPSNYFKYDNVYHMVFYSLSGT